MIHNLSAITLVCIGLAAITFALRPAHKICRIDPHIGWKALTVLMAFFLVGYISYMLMLLQRPSGLLEVMLAVILCAGGVFVGLVCTLSLQAIRRVRQLTIQLERHKTDYDELTGLPSRKKFYEQLDDFFQSSAPGQGTPPEPKNAAVFLLDIDDFKQICEGLGQRAGDQLISQLSQRLTQMLPFQCSIARHGGDEFALFYPGISVAQARLFADQLHKEMQQSFTLEQETLRITLRCGIATSPSDGQARSDLLQHAELALQQAKAQRLEHAFFDPSANHISRTELRLTQDLQDAVINKKFTLYFQPIVSARTLSFNAFEVLVRWQHDEGHMVSPEQFISLAEQKGYMPEITGWVIQNSFRQLQSWRQQSIPVRLHINLSILDLESPKTFDTIKYLIRKFDVRPEEIKFEVTESVMAKDVNQLLHNIQRLRDTGLEVGLDDFGTGYSSLSMFRDLPITQIKIDKSFILGILDSEFSMRMVYSTITLAHTMKRSVVAEGVETEAVAALLRQMGCDYLQGYFIAPPMPMDAAQAWLDKYVQRTPEPIPEPAPAPQTAHQPRHGPHSA